MRLIVSTFVMLSVLACKSRDEILREEATRVVAEIDRARAAQKAAAREWTAKHPDCRPNTDEIMAQTKRLEPVGAKGAYDVSILWGGPQGVFLEGEGLELLSFEGTIAKDEWTMTKELDACEGSSTGTPRISKATNCHPFSKDAWSCRVNPGKPICGVDAGTPFYVVVVNGHWDKHGTWQPGGITLSCDVGSHNPSSGAVAGCVTKFQTIDPACVRAYRADYCGDGGFNTIPGTWMDLTVIGSECARSTTGLPIEASWSGTGAERLEHFRAGAVDLTACGFVGTPADGGVVYDRRVAGTPTIQTQSD